MDKYSSLPLSEKFICRNGESYRNLKLLKLQRMPDIYYFCFTYLRYLFFRDSSFYLKTEWAFYVKNSYMYILSLSITG